jgi:hypothetical protein
VKEPYWSSHTTFLIGQVFVAILIAELYQHYLHHADHPRTVKDVAYPQTGKRLPNGEPERSRIPGYAGIFYDILRHPPQSIIEYLIGGEAPFAAMLPQLWRNETSFGEQITEPGDPWSAQLRDYLTFLETDGADLGQQLRPSCGHARREGRKRARALAGAAAHHRHAARGISASGLAAAAQVTRAGRARDRAPQSARGDSHDAGGRGTPGRRHVAPEPGDVRQTAKQAFRSPLPGMVQQLSMTQALHAYDARVARRTARNSGDGEQEAADGPREHAAGRARRADESVPRGDDAAGRATFERGRRDSVD